MGYTGIAVEKGNGTYAVSFVEKLMKLLPICIMMVSVLI